MSLRHDPHDLDLIGFVEGTLSTEEHDRVAGHLETCEACATEAQVLRAGTEAAKVLKGSLTEAERTVVERTLDRVAAEGASEGLATSTSNPTGRPRLRLVAALLVAAGGWAGGWASSAALRTPAGGPVAGGPVAGGPVADGPVAEGPVAGGPAALPGDPAVPAAPRPTHALFLLRRGPLSSTLGERYAEYAAWAGELRGLNRLVLAEAFVPGGTLLEGSDGPGAVWSGDCGAAAPAADAGCTIGFYVIEATDEEAIEIARRGPHGAFGGVTLVRAIYPTPTAGSGGSGSGGGPSAGGR